MQVLFYNKLSCFVSESEHSHRQSNRILFDCLCSELSEKDVPNVVV